MTSKTYDQAINVIALGDMRTLCASTIVYSEVSKPVIIAASNPERDIFPKAATPMMPPHTMAIPVKLNRLKLSPRNAIPNAVANTGETPRAMGNAVEKSLTS